MNRPTSAAVMIASPGAPLWRNASSCSSRQSYTTLPADGLVAHVYTARCKQLFNIPEAQTHKILPQ